jgi:hypothetical protein
MPAIDELDQVGEIGEVEIERILRVEEVVEPSAGFARQVMVAVHREASTPAPLAFPWRRLLAGIAGCGALIGAGAIAISRTGAEALLPTLPVPGPALAAAASGFGWTLAALAGTWLLTWFARHLVRT